MTRILLILIAFTFTVPVRAQPERREIRHGVKSIHDEEFPESEVYFRKAEDLNPESVEARYNIGNALYGQEKYEETAEQYQHLLEESEDKELSADLWYNMGNSLLEAKKYEESIEAYKNNLRLRPEDKDSRYNLAYARQKLQEQQQQQQEQQNQDGEGENKENKDQDQQDQQKQDEQDQEKQDQNKQENKDQQEQEKQAQQEQELKISPEDAERMLKAIQEQEKDVKEKVDKKKAAAAKVKTEKDW